MAEIANRIYETSEGQILFISDFSDINDNEKVVSRALSVEEKKGNIVRLANGVYLRPKNTRFGIVYPSIDEMVMAIAQRDESDSKLAITLSTRRDTVDYINDSQLQRLPGEPCLFRGHIQGEFPESSLPTPIELYLKTGAQVIFIKNDIEHQWVNGTLGTIIGFDEDEDAKIYVRTEEGKDVMVEPDMEQHEIPFQ